MKVYEVLARAFAAEGVTDVFGMMGDANLHWIDRLARLGITTYEVRHENGAVSMAQGHARIRGSVGVCTTTSGPGVTQVGTSMVIAARSATPVVMFAGETATGDLDGVQRFDNERFAAAVESGFVRVHSAEDAADAVFRAFYQARSESRPVILSAPMDVQMLDAADDALEGYRPSGEVFRRQRVVPDPEALATAADTIAASHRPVVLVGRGAMSSGAGEAVLKLAARVGALVCTTLPAKNYLGHDEFHAGISGTYGTRTALDLFQEADCLIGIGAGLNKHTTAAGYLYPGARTIHIDVRPHALMGGGTAADIYLQADARAAVELLIGALEERGFANVGYRTEEVRARLAGALDDPYPYDLEPGTVDPREVCRTLDGSLPSAIGLVLGSGSSTGYSTMLFTRPRDLVLPNQFFSSIGQGITAAIGAVVASDRRPCVLVDGDVSLMMYLPEFETAVRYGLPLMVVVLNDQGMGAEYHKLLVKGLDPGLAKLSTPDLGAVGRALGGRGRLARTIEEVVAAAEEFARDPAPTIVDVRTSGNVVTIPYRRLYYGLDV